MSDIRAGGVPGSFDIGGANSPLSVCSETQSLSGSAAVRFRRYSVSCLLAATVIYAFGGKVSLVS